MPKRIRQSASDLYEREDVVRWYVTRRGLKDAEPQWLYYLSAR